MAKIYPFRAYRPQTALAAQVAAVPYDVVNREEAKRLAENNPYSFLHLTKPEIDLPDEVGPYSSEVYRQGYKALQKFIEEKTLVQDDTPCLYAYALTMHGRTQTGIVCCACVDDYDKNIVRKHEYTRPQKEDDRVRNIEALEAQSGTVFLAHRQHPQLKQIMEKVVGQAPIIDFVAPDEIRHQLWVISDETDIQGMVQAFDDLGPIYIADGHHRSKAASRVAAKYRNIPGNHPESQRFLAVSFPEHELLIMGYNRVVRDLNGHSAEDFFEAIKNVMQVEIGKSESSEKSIGMYFNNEWHTLKVKDGSYNSEDPVDRLDVSILQSQILDPILAIKDPRRDERIDFVGGIRGDNELEKRVQNGFAVAFKLHPTSIQDLFAIADAQQVMPPKSTWFEPKLRDGLFVHAIEKA